MTCLHNHDQILEFLRLIFLKGLYRFTKTISCALIVVMHIILQVEIQYNASRCMTFNLPSMALHKIPQSSNAYLVQDPVFITSSIVKKD